MPAVEWMERRQVPLALAAIAVGAAAGLAAPAAAGALELAITPVLALLLLATFLGIPFARIASALRDVRFLATLLVANFVVVPLVAFALSRLVAHDRALLVGVLLVLLTPCIDYVIVFARLAGGAADRLLVAAPVLMIVQLLLLPVYLALFAGADVAAAIEPAPFVEALVVLVLLPLGTAIALQLLARRVRLADRVRGGVLAAMVPLLMATLAIVVASQIARVGARAAELAPAVPLFAAFVVAAVAVGVAAARVARLDAASARAVAFSTATRNSLVVLPLALALPDHLAIAPLVVVTQTLVELVAMAVLVRVVPRLLPHPSA